MRFKRGCVRGLLFLCAGVALFLATPFKLGAQENGMIQGTVTDPSKAAVPGAKVRIENPVSHHVQEVQTGGDGHFQIPNIPFNPYHLTATASGFEDAHPRHRCALERSHRSRSKPETRRGYHQYHRH